MNQHLEKLFYDLQFPSAFAGGDKILHAAKNRYSRKQIKEWLTSQDAHTIHKPVLRKYPRRYYNVQNINDTMEIDLMDLRSISPYNDNHNYVLVGIDLLSKFAFAEALKDKTSKSVTRAFKRFLDRNPERTPVLVQSDSGTEFRSREFQHLLKNESIKFRTTSNSESKAACIERFIRTLKSRIYRYLTYKNTKRYIDVLQQMIKNYNHTIHSSIKMPPASVTLQNAAVARKNLAEKYEVKDFRRPKFNIGMLVRISYAPRVFRKSYTGLWSREIFRITGVSSTRQPVVYKLEDLGNEALQGFFYEQELYPVTKDINSTLFEVEKILAVRGKGAKKEFFVKWLNYPSKFNKWILASMLQPIV